MSKDKLNNSNEKQTLEMLYGFSFLIMFVAIISNIIFNINLFILGGIGAICLGLIQFYLKDKIWYLFWTLVPAKPPYVKLMGWFLIFVGLLFMFIGVI